MRHIDRKDSRDEDERRVKSASAGIALILLLIIAVISLISFIVEMKFGKKAGTLVLIIIAALLAAYLYRKEIGNFFRRNR
ncbi:MAG: hypothetical protein ACI4KE_04765 [Anaerovoracaceae bacterium]